MGQLGYVLDVSSKAGEIASLVILLLFVKGH